MKIAVYIVYGVSQALYKLFGVNTPSRKAWLKQEARKIQDALDKEHCIKDKINYNCNTEYTTKKAMEIAKDKGWI